MKLISTWFEALKTGLIRYSQQLLSLSSEKDWKSVSSMSSENKISQERVTAILNFGNNFIKS